MAHSDQKSSRDLSEAHKRRFVFCSIAMTIQSYRTSRVMRKPEVVGSREVPRERTRMLQSRTRGCTVPVANCSAEANRASPTSSRKQHVHEYTSATTMARNGGSCYALARSLTALYFLHVARNSSPPTTGFESSAKLASSGAPAGGKRDPFAAFDVER